MKVNCFVIGRGWIEREGVGCVEVGGKGRVCMR